MSSLIAQIPCTHVSPDDSKPVPLWHLAVRTLYMLLRDALVSVGQQVMHQHPRLKLLHLTQLARWTRTDDALHRSSRDLPPSTIKRYVEVLAEDAPARRGCTP